MTKPADVTAVRPQEETPTAVVPSAGTDGGQFSPGTILGGRYRIVSLVGSGGMGAVYRGDDLKLGQPIAMKFLRRTSAARERMLYDEVRIGRQVSHPNICRLYDITEVDGQIFITMEFVDGEDLASLLRRIERLPHDKATSVARELCAGLAAAHEMGVIHRDLKPGNVMLDGRGRARITDFGLAIAESDREQAAAGTPAYMAPEQLIGGRATVQSDIYALGLVLYELFTGRQMYSGATLSEIISQQRDATITRPSDLIKDIDPKTEQAILRCLDRDPARRPQSVAEMTRALPSFDPLAAAVAAGDTPSPAMVAAASERGDLRIATAWTLLSMAVLSIAGVGLLSARSLVVNNVGEIKAPAILLEQTRSLIVSAGLQTPPRDVAWYYLPDPTGDVPIQFVYRRSPQSMLSTRFDRVLTFSDPPLTASGMASVRRDAAGRLLEMAIVPPQQEPAPPPVQADYAPMFAQARIDRAMLVPVASEWAAPVGSDSNRAWMVRGTQRRIEAASYHGTPVWFAVIDPGTRPTRMTPIAPHPAERISVVTVMVTLLLVTIAAILFAFRNLRRGQGDRRGALRIALTVFAAMFIAAVFRANHVRDVRDESLMLFRMVAEQTFWAAIFWLAYIAVEPLVRKRWPRMLISWSRMLNGRWRDPMVARDVLIGIAAGAAIALTAHATFLAGTERMFTSITPIGSFRHTIYIMLFTGVDQAIGRALFGAVLLLTLRAIFRRMDIVMVMAVLLSSLAVADMPGGPIALRVIWAVLASSVVYAIFFRFGMLTIAATSYAALILTEMPITSDPGSWYFGTSMFVLASLAVPAIFAFWQSLGGKSPLPRLAVD